PSAGLYLRVIHPVCQLPDNRRQIPLTYRAPLAEGTHRGGAGAAPARAAIHCAPGRVRASCSPALRPAREVLSLDWDRRPRVTPAETTSQEAWPGSEPLGPAVPQAASRTVERRQAGVPEKARRRT